MLRTTRFDYHASALRHNLKIIQQHAPDQAVMAMVKANAYGCGIERVVPDLDGWVEYFGVVGLNEAHAVAQLGATTPCVILRRFSIGRLARNITASLDIGSSSARAT